MSNQAHSGRMRDAEKKRREYLHSKGLAIILVFAGVVTTAYIIWTLPFLIYDGVYWQLEAMRPDAMALHVDLTQYWSYAGFCLAIEIASAFVLRYSVKRVKSLPIAPPVAEQIATLPANAILVRGSDEPTATPEELLRAAREATATDTKELLRAEGRTV